MNKRVRKNIRCTKVSIEVWRSVKEHEGALHLILLHSILLWSICIYYSLILNNCQGQKPGGTVLVHDILCTISKKIMIRKIREKRGKIRKTWSMIKKRSSEILVGEKIFRPPKLGARFPPLIIVLCYSRQSGFLSSMHLVILLRIVLHSIISYFFSFYSILL